MSAYYIGRDWLEEQSAFLLTLPQSWSQTQLQGHPHAGWLDHDHAARPSVSLRKPTHHAAQLAKLAQRLDGLTIHPDPPWRSARQGQSNHLTSWGCPSTCPTAERGKKKLWYSITFGKSNSWVSTFQNIWPVSPWLGELWRSQHLVQAQLILPLFPVRSSRPRYSASPHAGLPREFYNLRKPTHLDG